MKTRWIRTTELLGALGIIATVVVLLMPALGQIRVRPRPVWCVGHLMRLARAIQMYAQDFDDVLPSSYSYPNGWGNCPMLTWADLIYPYVGDINVYRCQARPAFFYVRDSGRLGCADIAMMYGTPPGKEPGTTVTPWALGYLYNESYNDRAYCDLCDCTTGLDCFHGLVARSVYSPTIRDTVMDMGAPISAVANPANTIALSDGNPPCTLRYLQSFSAVTVFRFPRDTDVEHDTRGNAYRGTGCYTPGGEKTGRVHKRHFAGTETGANHAFLDGHVQWLRQTTPSMWTRYDD